MALKKSDKLIAIIGIVILIVAAVGIVLYASNENEKEVPTNEEEKPIKIFEVNYSEESLSINPDNIDYSIKPKLIRQSTWTGNIVLNEQNLKSLDIMIEYHDNFHGLLFKNFLSFLGADKLTITVYKDDKELGMAQIKGDGIEFINISIGSLIPISTIEAKDLNEAIVKLEEQYIDYNLTYNIQITLKTGLWQIFREMLGKDTFDLKVNYIQFVYDLTNPEGNGDDNIPPTGGYEDGSQTWATMAYPGKN